jgi:hypothetical protein
MLNLFVKGSKVINDDDSNLVINNIRDNRLNTITKELMELLNTTDINENKIFTNQPLENKIVALYNRTIGYRNTEKSIAMLHTIMCIVLKKMQKVKNASRHTHKKLNVTNLNTKDATNQPSVF